MKFKPLDRRASLRGTGSIVIALPLLEAMEAQGQTTPFPKRFIGLANFDGTHYPNWLPKAVSGGNLVTFGEILSPLTPFMKRIIQFGNMNNGAAILNSNGDGHPGGVGALLTGRRLQPGNVYSGGGGSNGWADGISLDQYLGKTVGKNDRFPTLTLACQPLDVSVLSHMSYSGPAQPVPAITSPLELFNKLFSGYTPPTTGTTPTTPTETVEMKNLRLRRQSILDAAAASMNRLSARLGAADRAKLDQHATSIREIEKQLTSPPDATPIPTGSGCLKPAQPGSTDYNASANFDKASAGMIDLTVIAMACGLTRSASIQWGRSTGGLTFPFVPNFGNSNGQHAISHMSESAGAPFVTKINQWFAGQMAVLMDKLSKVPEGGGSLLDSTMIFRGNGLGRGVDHTQTNVPFVLGGGGGFNYGRFLSCGGAPHNGLLLAILNKMGVPDTSFGDPAVSKPVPGLL